MDADFSQLLFTFGQVWFVLNWLLEWNPPLSKSCMCHQRERERGHLFPSLGDADSALSICSFERRRLYD